MAFGDLDAGGRDGQTHRMDKRKQSLYFPEDMLAEIQSEANRLDRSISWVVQRAWMIARKEIERFQGVEETIERAVAHR